MDRKTAETDHDRHGARLLRDVDYDGVSAGRTVLERAVNGRDICALALTGSAYMAYEDYESGLVDALANLMHFARRYELNFEQGLARARRHHRDEAECDWDEVPS